MGFPPLKVTDQDGNSAIPVFEIALPEGTRVNKSGIVGTLVAPKEFVESLIKGDSSDAELSVGDWLAYDDGAVATPTDDATGGTGGAPSVISIARTVVAGEILNGTASLKVAKTAADGQGEGVSVSSIPVPRHLRGKTVQLKFLFETGAGYVADYYRVFGIAQDGASAGLVNVLNNGGGDGSLGVTPSRGLLFTGSMTLPDDVTLIRIAVHGTSTDATAFDLFLDDIRLEEISTVNTPVFGPWLSYTPTLTGFGTATGIEFEFRQSAQNVEIRGEFTIGTPTAVEAQCTLPTNLTIHTDINANTLVGSYGRSVSSAESDTIIVTGDDAFVNFGVQSGSTNGLSPVNGDALSGRVSLVLSVRVNEFDAGAILSTAQANLDTVKASVSSITNQSVTSTATTVVEFDNKFFDSHEAFDNVTNFDFEVPIDGDYRIETSFVLTAVIANDQMLLQIRKNGTGIFQSFFSSDDTVITLQGAVSISLVKDDLIDITVTSQTDTAYTISGSVGRTNLAVTRLPDFKVFGLRGTNQFFGIVSSIKTPVATSQWMNMTGNEQLLPPGSFAIHWSMDYGSSGNPSYQNTIVRIAAADGADSGSAPALFSTLSGVTLDAGDENISGLALSSSAATSNSAMSGSARFTLTETQTVFLVPFASEVTPANARVTATMYIERIA